MNRPRYVFGKSAEKLYSRLSEVYEEIKDEKKVEIFGNLDFDIVWKIDSREDRVAKIKGRKILVKINAVKLPKNALKYIIAHEIAHTIAKGHTDKYWKIVKTIYPEYERGRRSLQNCEHVLSKPMRNN